LKGLRILKRLSNARLQLALTIPLLTFSAFAADTLTGTVKNNTTGKPAAGDEVVLLKLGQSTVSYTHLTLPTICSV